MEVKIGPYTLYKRTEYSKIQVLDENGENIAKYENGRKIADKIISDYNDQIKDKYTYFDIIEDELRKLNGNLEYIFMPDYIEYIGYSALISSSVKYVNLPSSLTRTGPDIFRNCRKLEEIILPPTLERLGDGAFDSCVSLKKAILSEKMSNLPANCFSNCKSLKELVLPDSIKIINTAAFAYCKSLEKINIPRDFEGFGRQPFINSTITTLKFNHDISDVDEPEWTYSDYLINTNIYKIEISKDVGYIDPNFFKYANGKKSDAGIMKIDYLGSKDDFENFRRNNKKLFKVLKHAQVNTIEDLEGLIENKENNKKNKEIFHIFER